LALPSQAAPADDASPTLWLLRVLAVMIGMPFLVLSTTGPLLQRWYAWTDGPRAQDPYFLFAASNLGSFGGLLAYPFLIEPHLTVTQQRWSWSIGFAVFAVLVAACGLVVTRGGAPSIAPEAVHVTARPTTRRVLGWAALAFLPSSLMLAVTAHLSTDVAAIPLLWVLPLAIYLATFVGAFARASRTTPVAVTRLATALAFVSALLIVSGVHMPVLLSIAVHLSTLAVVGYAAHARLATTRPKPDHLTGFYVVVAVGGAVGGLLNGLVAPLVFNRVWEYGFTLAAVPLLLIGLTSAPKWLSDRYHPAFTVIAVTALLLPVGMVLALALSALAGRSTVLAAIGLAACALAGWWVSQVPIPAAVFLALGFLAVGLNAQSAAVATERTFFGAYQVLDLPGERVLTHGTTAHGKQLTDLDLRTEPTAYFARSGPLGAVFETWESNDVGVVGLGAGTMAAYGEPGHRMTFFEIDGEIADLAADPEMFSFIEDSRGDIDVEVGDGRLLVDQVPSGSYDLMVLDAFSSDSIPVHLLTREALAGFADRVREDGALVVHISNRVFDLEPVLAAAEEDLGWHAAIGRGGSGVGATESRWVVLTRDEGAAASLRARDDWRALDHSRLVHWTDDYSSILSVLG
ncbi:MAG: fused MFS/spermidine synthase, partial [Nocardioides sp.]|uniref:fused MFS/spermidine synthase n=1 Tax=Nocardioides sp. TaxID=35761 RepID=UPI0032667C61